MATNIEGTHAKIREQVEYYFSDENLGRPDHYLRDRMRKGNHPVPLLAVCNFKKMRCFGFEHVKVALQASSVINVVDFDGTICIQRKVPFLWEKGDEVKKRKTKPTGFEDYFTDPPRTVGEFSEEKDLYDGNLPFAERIETALQRFQTRRRFNSHRRNIFDKWLRYGGIDSGQKQFSGGFDQNDLEGKSKDEIRSLTATTFVGDDKYEEGKDAPWDVDFESVIKGFLSTMVPYYWDFQSSNENKDCIGIFRNFYNYILGHDVCPEYTHNLLAARRICDLADGELFATHIVMSLVPGEFNVACSTIFGGFYKDLNDQSQSSAKSSEPGPQTEKGISEIERMGQVFATACAAYGMRTTGTIEPSGDSMSPFGQTVLKKEVNIGLEVTGIVSVNAAERSFYHVDGCSNIKPLGRLLCAPFTIPDFQDLDLPAGFKATQRPRTYELFLEQDIIDHCFIGMKLEATVCTLDGGLTFLDHVTAIHCSFFQVLENELWNKWKEPQWIDGDEHLAADEDGLEADDVAD